MKITRDLQLAYDRISGTEWDTHRCSNKGDFCKCLIKTIDRYTICVVAPLQKQNPSNFQNLEDTASNYIVQLVMSTYMSGSLPPSAYIWVGGNVVQHIDTAIHILQKSVEIRLHISSMHGRNDTVMMKRDYCSKGCTCLLSASKTFLFLCGKVINFIKSS